MKSMKIRRKLLKKIVKKLNRKRERDLLNKDVASAEEKGRE